MHLTFLLRSSLATALFLFATTASGAEDCRKLKDAEARLACFDALYPSQDEKADDVMSDNILGPILTEEMEETVIEKSSTADTETLSDKAKRNLAKKERAQNEKALKKKRGLFESGDKQYFEGTIVEMLSKPQQRMVFRFDNDEIWIQTTPRNLPIKVGDKVTIRRGTVGGYILRTENKVSTKISQIPTD